MLSLFSSNLSKTFNASQGYFKEIFTLGSICFRTSCSQSLTSFVKSARAIPLFSHAWLINFVQLSLQLNSALIQNNMNSKLPRSVNILLLVINKHGILRLDTKLLQHCQIRLCIRLSVTKLITQKCLF